MAKRFVTGIVLALIALTTIHTQPVRAAGAPNDHTVLILAASVSGGLASKEAVKAIALGYTVELATDAVWLGKTAAEFATYRALIIGDPMCVSHHGPILAAEANAAVWGSVVDGNVIIIGTDPVFHAQWQPGGTQLVNSGIAYALSAPISAGKTAAYITLGCSFNDAGAGQPVPILDAFGSFNVSDNATCHDDIFITAPAHPSMAGLDDAALSNWQCSIHSIFTSWPSNFTVLAMADGLGSSYSAGGHQGAPYLLARGNCDVVPTVSIVSLKPQSLWPPNHKFVDIVASVDVTGDNVNVTRTVTCNEIPKKPWTVFYEDGSDVYHFGLRSDRNGGGSGRIYTVTYTVTDGCGRTVSASGNVVVPHDQGKN